MSLESTKTLGGIGAIFLAIPFLSLVGIILVLIAMKGMSEYYEDEGIFKNTLYGFIFGFVGVIALIVVILMFAFGFANVSPIVTDSTAVTITAFGLFIIAFIILYVFSLIGAIFYKRSLDILSTKSEETVFSTSGVILLVGAIIPLIGEILKFIAWILAGVGFFSIKESKKTQTQAVKNETSEKRFCTKCGTQLKPESIYCQKCGKKLTEK